MLTLMLMQIACVCKIQPMHALRDRCACRHNLQQDSPQRNKYEGKFYTRGYTWLPDICRRYHKWIKIEPKIKNVTNIRFGKGSLSKMLVNATAGLQS